jgi:hypothetical protein
MIGGFLDPTDEIQASFIAIALLFMVTTPLRTGTMPKGMILFACIPLALAGIGFLTASFVPTARSLPGLSLFVECMAAVGLLIYGIVKWIEAPRLSGAGQNHGSLARAQLFKLRLWSLVFTGLGLMVAINAVLRLFRA